MREFAGVMNERPTAAAHRVVAEVVKPGDLVVDATAGNGHDTLFLAGLVGEKGKVLAFDVQAAAIRSTTERLAGAGFGDRVEILQESHANLPDRVEEASVKAVMFNLGYLPGGDHSITTEAGDSGKAVMNGLMALMPGGVMTIVCYTGHPGGDVEAEAIVLALKQVREQRSLEEFDLEVGEPTKEKSPFLVVVRKFENGL